MKNPKKVNTMNKPLAKDKIFTWYNDYCWQIVLVMLFAAIVNYIDRVNLSFATNNIRHDFGLSVSQSGYLLAAWMWPYAIANLPSGWLIDRLGINKIFIGSVIIWSIATILSGFSQSFTSLYMSRIILGIAEAPFFVIGGKIVLLYFEPNRRGLAASMINLGPKIANGFGPPLIALLIILTTWRGMFIILGLLGFIAVALWIKIYQKPQLALSEKPNSMKPSIYKLLKHKTVFWLNLGNFGSSYVFWLYFTWLPTYLMDKRGLDLKATGFIAALPFLAGVIAVPFGGYLSDLLIRKYNFSVIKARIIPAVGGCIIAGFTVIPINYVDSLTIAVILFTISTFAVSARVGVLWALVSDISPENAVGTFGGIQNCASFIGGALAPTISGIVLEHTGNYNIVFGISGVLILFAAWCYAMINKPILTTEIAI
jgi:MFS family permease